MTRRPKPSGGKLRTGWPAYRDYRTPHLRLRGGPLSGVIATLPSSALSSGLLPCSGGAYVRDRARPHDWAWQPDRAARR